MEVESNTCETAPSVCQSVFRASVTRCGLTLFLFVCFLLQKYRHHDEDSSPQDQSSPQLTEEAGGAELVQVAEKNLSQIQNVHGYVSHAHISPMKVDDLSSLCVCLSIILYWLSVSAERHQDISSLNGHSPCPLSHLLDVNVQVCVFRTIDC